MRSFFVNGAKATIAATIIAVSSALPLPAKSKMPFKQYETAADIPIESFKQHDVIYGRVEQVTDGDTFRVRHYPYYPFSVGKNYDGRLSDHTMVIRVYGVDCPEIAKFGNPSMPYGDAAKDFTEQLINNKVVRIKLLRIDQYNRAVAKVTIPGFLPFTKKDITLQLAERGLATLYTGGGAEYDNKLDLIKKKIELAKKRKRGVWTSGKKLETPAEFKRKNKRVADDLKTSELPDDDGYAAKAY